MLQFTPKPSMPSAPRTGPWWVCLPMGPSQGWGGGSTFGTPWLHYFPNTRDRKYGKWKRRQRDIISPEQGLESGIKSPAPRGSCENAAVTAPGSPPAPLGALSGGIVPAGPIWGLGTGPAPGGPRGDGEAAAGTAGPRGCWAVTRAGIISAAGESGFFGRTVAEATSGRDCGAFFMRQEAFLCAGSGGAHAKSPDSPRWSPPPSSEDTGHPRCYRPQSGAWGRIRPGTAVLKDGGCRQLTPGVRIQPGAGPTAHPFPSTPLLLFL